MFAQVTRLQYWKSEHTAQTCEDAFGTHLAGGVLAVADGVGSTLFSNLWARHLVQHFLTTPLLSDDPFEVEWWLRLAQERYPQQLPDLERMPWNVLQKVQREGSSSTLATVCITQASTTGVQAQLLAIGDSCIFVKKARSERLFAFPLTTDNDFNQSPLCFPSKLSAFNRYFQRPDLASIELTDGDVVVLATDALARWLISAGKGTCASQEAALALLLAQSPATWEDFIRQRRERAEISDDDCTALLMTVRRQAVSIDDELIVANAGHGAELRAQRFQAFMRAVELQNKELAALYFGDGRDLEQEGVIFPREQLQQARQVADALREMLQALRREIDQPEAAAKLAPLWQRYALLLGTEPCAASLRKTLEHIGVTVTTLPVGVPAEMAALSPRSIAQRRQHELKFSLKDRDLLALELQLQQALSSMDDAAIVAAYERVRYSPHAQAIVARLQCKEQIQQALQREEARVRMQRAPLPPVTATIPPIPTAAISEIWFGKICQVKKAYLFHWALRKVSAVELEQETLDDLVNASLIREGIEQANAAGASPPLLPEALLPEIFQTFSLDSMVKYDQLLRETGLTDDNVKALLMIFLSRQLFEEYLLWDRHIQLQDWLQQQYGLDSAVFRRDLEATNPWVKKFRWWRD
jgi:Serine/threonine protein phosphatase